MNTRTAGDTPGHEHALLGHWGWMAVLALLSVLWGLIGADRPGWRFVAWYTAIVSAAFGLQSLLFPRAASTPTTGWAVAATVWVVGYLVAAERRAGAVA